MQQTPSQRGIYARAALLSAIALPALLAGQQQASADEVNLWAGYGNAPRSHSGLTISDARPANANDYELVNSGMSAATIAGIINNANNASTIIFQGGNYENVSNINVTRSGVTLRADQNAKVWLDGSVLVTTWTRESSTSPLWSTNTQPTQGTNAGSNYEFAPRASPENTDNTKNDGTYTETNPRADDGEMVFVGGTTRFGGTPQVQVPTKDEANELNEFYVDRTNHKIYVNSGSVAPKNVYISRHDKAFIINAQDVKLRGLNFQRYVGRARPRTGPTDNGGPPGLTVEFEQNGGEVDRCVFFWNGHGGLGINANMIIERSEFVSNGWNGIGTTTKNSAIRGNYIAFNNVEGFNNVWNAAGIKLSSSAITENVDIYDNEIYANRATGVWIDIYANNVRVFRNYIHGNVSNGGNPTTGVFFEISKNCTAAFNLISGNGAGINVAASPNTRIYNNTLYNNNQHFYINDQTGRQDPSTGTELRVSVEAANNILIGGGTPAIEAVKGGPFEGKGGSPKLSQNRFTVLNANVYRDTPTPVFNWLIPSGPKPYLNLAAFLAAPDTDTGTFEGKGQQRTSSVFVNAGTRDFRVLGTDTEVARNGLGLPTAIRGLLRDQAAYPFVSNAIGTSDLDVDSIGSFGAAPATGTYRGAFKPN